MSSAPLPSTWSAFSPVATPLALVVNGAALTLPEVIEPTSVPPLAENSKARPLARLLERMHGELPVVEPPSAERQP